MACLVYCPTCKKKVWSGFCGEGMHIDYYYHTIPLKKEKSGYWSQGDWNHEATHYINTFNGRCETVPNERLENSKFMTTT